MNHKTLADVRQLNTEQYDAARAVALDRVKARIGQRPTRAQFQRELGQQWTVLDVLGLVIFIAALVISSLHIMDYVAAQVSEEGTYKLINQIGYIFLAEASVILFMVMHNLTASRRAQRPAALRPASVHLLLAGLAATFIFVANLASGVGLLLSVMPPVFTIGIAMNLERLIVASIKRREDVSKRYLAALAEYELATKDPESHPRFNEYFAQALWDKIVSLKANKIYVDAPSGFKVAAVRREMQREQWMHAAPQDVAEIESEAKSGPGVPFGSSPATRDAPESIQTTELASANGHVVAREN